MININSSQEYMKTFDIKFVYIPSFFRWLKQMLLLYTVNIFWDFKNVFIWL